MVLFVAGRAADAEALVPPRHVGPVVGLVEAVVPPQGFGRVQGAAPAVSGDRSGAGDGLVDEEVPLVVAGRAALPETCPVMITQDGVAAGCRPAAESVEAGCPCPTEFWQVLISATLGSGLVGRS